MAGVAGLEPAHDGIKTRCLTTWRHPIKYVVIQFVHDPGRLNTYVDFTTITQAKSDRHFATPCAAVKS